MLLLKGVMPFQASIKVKAGRRRNSKRKGRETEANTSSFPFCSRCGLRFIPSQRYPPMQERQLLCSQEERIHAIPLFKFKQERVYFVFLWLAKFPTLGFYHDEEMRSKKERDRFVRAAVYESTLPLLSNANVWFCPTSKVTEVA